jgi:hypothetical protein
MAIPSKGLNHIQTLSGRVDQLALPYRVYMQVTCLEMEKARRQSERRSARCRMAALDARLQEIEVEKANLLQAIERGPSKRNATLPRMKLQEPVKRNGGFKIRY